MKDLGTPSNNRDKKPYVRKRTYWTAFNRTNSTFKTIDKDLYAALFFEPFYQLMRLQLLAQETELSQEKEMEADVVSVLHICPQANKEFRNRVTSPYLANTFPGKGILDIWKELVLENRFMSISVENLLDIIIERSGISNQKWANYLKTRYGWARSD